MCYRASLLPSGRRLGKAESRVEARGRIRLHRGIHVAVQVERDSDRRMPEPFRDDFDVHATAQELDRVGVPEVVEPNPRDDVLGPAHERISHELDRWERGEIEYRYQHKQLSVEILDALILKKRQIHRLMEHPRTPKVDAEIYEAIEDHNRWADLSARITQMTEEANAKGVGKFSGIDLDAIASFSDGWQALVQTTDATGRPAQHTMAQLAAAHAAPIQIHRDENGRAIGASRRVN
jgi:hypothetical protein